MREGSFTPFGDSVRVPVRCAALLLAMAVLAVPLRAIRADDIPIGLKVPPGFEVSLYADDDLAHDIYSMTFDAKGRVVVSGAGYVRILIDADGDGRAESFRQYVDGPKSGAQGMCFYGGDLLCTGDAGLIRYRDRDGDDRADGPPDVFLKMKTGGEHHTHAVQKGPDGWWHVIAGNFAGISASYATLPTSPVKSPESGVLLRLKPDLTGGEIVCDGMRNAYDFAFHPSGDVFTYDSDGEREISLPWYRPTRVFQLTPGSHAGWITESWKHPNAFPNMPAVMAEFGRGSPTGVTCYRHRKFPAEYQGAIFALDWTFGRVMALPLKKSGGGWSSVPIPFMTAVDDFGFAPTDAEVGPDGALYVSVGGRGTRGSVFRVVWKGELPETPTSRGIVDDKLADILDAPQPLSSWSRAAWEPAAAELGAAKFAEAAAEARLSSAARVRAIEILTELFDGPPAEALKILANAEITTDVGVRARAAWSIGRTAARSVGLSPRYEPLRPFLLDTDPLVARNVLEALAGLPADTDLGELAPAVIQRLADDDPAVRAAALRVIARLPAERQAKMIAAVNETGARGVLTFSLGRTLRSNTVDRPAIDIALGVLEGSYPVEWKRDAARLLQQSLGDVGPREKLPAVFDGYTSRIDLSKSERELDPVRARLARVYPTGDDATDRELGRAIAMLSPLNPALLDHVLSGVGDSPGPLDDVHRLVIAARIPVERTAKQRDVIAGGFVRIDQKLKARGMNQDTNWLPRMTELYRRHVELDPSLPAAVARHADFGRPTHVAYLNGLAKDSQPAALERFIERSRTDPQFEWSSDLLFLLGDSGDAAHRELVRKQFESPGLRPAVLMVLSNNAEEQDQERFVTGLESGQLEVLTACLEALHKLPADRTGPTQVALVRALRRLGSDPKEIALRDSVVRLLERNTGQEFEYRYAAAPDQPQSEAIARWSDWVAAKFPAEAARHSGSAAGDVDWLKKLLPQIDWNAGDATRGRTLFEKRQCGQCHGGSRALGPDLAGATRRFSRDDLLTAIVDPNRDVSPRYQTTLIQTRAGKVHTGLIIYQSVDGILMRTATNQTLRFESDEIEERRSMAASLMPAGLLKDATAQDVADLYAHLRNLSP